MIRHYFKIAVRTINKSRNYSLMNVLGLAIGMACCLLILLWVNDELSYDKFHENYRRLFRVTAFSEQQGSALTPVPLASALKVSYAEVENSTRFNIEGPQLITYKDKRFTKDVMAIADNDFLNMFSFPLKIGDVKNALKDIYSVVISEKVALKIFGNENPIGKTLKINDRGFVITGVMTNIPHDSHIQFDFITPFDSRKEYIKQLIDNRWDVSAYYTYVQLSEQTKPIELQKKIGDFIQQRDNESDQTLMLQKITDIHFGHGVEDYLEGHNDIKYVYLFSGLALLILIIACMNFINLTTARASVRTKEIGLRKVMGAYRSDLIRQFLSESVLLTLIALFIASLLVEAFLPALSDWSGKDLVIDYFDISSIFFALCSLTLIVGVIAGSYPAMYLSSFKPSKVLRGDLLKKGNQGMFRKILIIIQFSCSIFLIISAVVIHRQLNHINNKNYGFDKEHILNFKMMGSFRDNYKSLVEELKTHHNIQSISGGLPPSEVYSMAASVNWVGKFSSEKIDFFQVAVDHNYIDLFGLEIMEGSGFSEKTHHSEYDHYVINETAKRMMGTDSVLGKEISFQTWRGDFIDHKGKVIGVVKDFQNGSLYNKIHPIIMYVDREALFTMDVRINPTNVNSTIEHIKQKWDHYVPKYPFEYQFVDTTLNNYYHSERKLSTLFDTFTFLAVFISCLGLFGLTSYSIDQRTKEIGIRKILGATVSNILFLFVRHAMNLILIASVFACPIAYFLMNNWLTNFSSRINIGFITIMSAILTGLLIAVLTTVIQSLQAASVNPIKSIRKE